MCADERYGMSYIVLRGRPVCATFTEQRCSNDDDTLNV